MKNFQKFNFVAQNPHPQRSPSHVAFGLHLIACVSVSPISIVYPVISFFPLNLSSKRNKIRDFEQDRNPRNRNFDALNFRKTALLNPAFVKSVANKLFFK